jgi:carbon-monoxide dehydrogenase medium subunit
VISTAFDYQRATSVDDALAKLGAGGAKLLAGGHSLIPLMKLRLSEPQVLIDISRIKELSGIRQSGGAIEIGAGTVHSEVAASTLCATRVPSSRRRGGNRRPAGPEQGNARRQPGTCGSLSLTTRPR